MLFKTFSHAGGAQSLVLLSEKAEIKHADIKSIRGNINSIPKTNSPALDGAKMLIFKVLYVSVNQILSGQALTNCPALSTAVLFLFAELS